MLNNVLKYSLTILLACAFFVGSGAFAGTGNFPDVHEKQKGIRSYENTNFPQDNGANFDLKSVGHHRGTKSGDHDYNKDSDGCSKCKWENDDYWERDEPEEEEDENNGDECDDGNDGQYKSDKTHHHDGNESKGHASTSHPSRVYKIRPIDIYSDNIKGEVKGSKPDGPFGAINFPRNTGYTGSTSGYGSTLRPGSTWNIPFVGTSKPGYSGVTTDTFVTTPSYGSGIDWNRRTTTAGYGLTSKFTWEDRYGDTFAENFKTTPNPIWSTGFGSTPTATGFPSSQKPENIRPIIPWNIRRDNTPIRNFGSTVNLGQDRNIGFNGKSGSSWNSNQGTKSISTFGCIRPDTSCSQGNHGPIKIGATPFASDLAKNDESPSSISLGTSHQESASTFGSTKNLQGGFGLPGTVPSAHGNTLSPGKLSESSNGDSIHGHAGAFKPGYGTGTTATSFWSSASTESSVRPASRITHPHTGFPVINFGTTKPFGYMNMPGSSGSTYGNARPKPTAFNVACCSTITNTSANAFGTSFGTHNTPDIIETFVHSTPSIHTGSSSYSVKNSFGNIRPIYGTGLGTQPDDRIGASPGKQSGDRSTTWSGRRQPDRSETRPGTQLDGGNTSWLSKPESSIVSDRHLASGAGTWLSRKIGDGSITTPGKHPEANRGTWPATKPGSGITSDGHSIIGTSPEGYSADGNNAWPTQQSGDGSGTWPGGQVGHESRRGCSNGNCGSSTSPFSRSNSCEGNYNCGGGCSGRNNNAPAIHGPCDEVISGPSGVNKIYYPAGTGDGNIPNIANTYEPGLFPNVGSEIYPGVNTECGRGDNSCNQGGADVTRGNPVQWNSANPFLHGSVGSIRDALHVWSGTTLKPIGKENPFLDSSWSNPKPGGNNANNDRNVIPFGPENINPSSGTLDRAGSGSQGTGPLQCQFGLFGCGTPGSGSYVATKDDKHPGEVHGEIGGNIGVGIRGPGNVNSGSGNNFPGSIDGVHTGSYAGSFNSAQASSFANAKSLSFSGAGGHDNNFGQANSESWSSSGAQNQGEPNPWASSGASAFASSSAGSWSGNYPVDVKG